MSASASARLSVLVASRLIDDVQRELDRAFEATFEPTTDPGGWLRARGREVDALLLSLDVPMSTEAIEALPSGVAAIATYSVGTDHIDLEAARRRGLAVFNTPGVLADSVAENALLLMLGAARRATEAIALLREGRWRGWTPTQLVGVQLSGRRLGILGMGDIGTRVATRAQALGMEILYCNRRRLPDDESRGFAWRASPEALIADADVLLVACPSTPETRGLVDARLLAGANPELIVVNIARGDIVDDAALVAALREGRIRAAGLDVFAGEPRIEPAYFDLPQVFMLPHTGSSTQEARLGMGRILIEALELWQRGGAPTNRVC